jgi:adenylate kinase
LFLSIHFFHAPIHPSLKKQNTQKKTPLSLGEGFFTGLPLALSGCARMMRDMDWVKDEDDGSGVATPNPAAALVSSGDVSATCVADHPDGPADVFFVIGPQNMSGACVSAPLEAMVAAAEETGATTILVNPSLADVPSSGGLMSVRGRGDRLAFEASFVDAYYFRLLFSNPSIPYPILGALRHVYGGHGWEVWAREDDMGAEGRERYVLAGRTPERPTPGEMTALLRERRKAVERAELEAARAAARGGGSGGSGGGGWWKFW